ncbi:hypothetical protein RRG08_017259 [Elysia crispata]|uniref:Uncharacterized protein n=1 Tax=Elysia crispata TaxID=231223 RepID=A0AAE1B2G8_9GAST|nr:hypothetical protein RRG08_017259 [Elysia crispata]
MYHLTLVALLSVVAMATPTLACSTPLPTYKFRQLYCDADLVFRGFQVQASSSLATDLYGREVQSGRYTFEVQHLYKGSGGSMIDVSHTWTEGDPCPAGAFPDGGIDYLVFSAGGAVETCRHSFPWSCVPDSFKNSLPIQC